MNALSRDRFVYHHQGCEPVRFNPVVVVEISEQIVGRRGLADVALARGDSHTAARHYGGIVAKAAIGRGRRCWWAEAEYGWLMFEEGQVAAAREHLEGALQVWGQGCRAVA